MTLLSDTTHGDYRQRLAGGIKGLRDRMFSTRAKMAASPTHPADWWWAVCYRDLRIVKTALVNAQNKTGLQAWLRDETNDPTFDFDVLLAALITAVDAVLLEVFTNYPWTTNYISLDGSNDVQYLQIAQGDSDTLRSLMTDVVTAADALV